MAARFIEKIPAAEEKSYAGGEGLIK